GEGTAVVPHLEPVREKPEAQLGRAGVLGVLDQLEDEVRALAVQLAEQFESGGVPAVAADVLLADLLVVGGHHPTVGPAGGRCGDCHAAVTGTPTASAV